MNWGRCGGPLVPATTGGLGTFFEKYPVLLSKSKDFKDLVKISNLMASKAHLTPDGLNKIKNIKSGMNSLRMFQ